VSRSSSALRLLPKVDMEKLSVAVMEGAGGSSGSGDDLKRGNLDITTR
jgi:hypothetical protein